jgi:hypothetical protein
LIKLTAFLFLFSFSALAGITTGTEPDVIFQKDIDRQGSLIENYPVKICVGELGYAAMAAKTDDSHCRGRADISYDDCIKIGKEGRDFSQVIVNKIFKVKTGNVIYLKKHIRYSLVTGSGGVVKDFSKESKSIFLFHTANYGGVALDPVKKCP